MVEVGRDFWRSSCPPPKQNMTKCGFWKVNIFLPDQVLRNGNSFNRFWRDEIIIAFFVQILLVTL